MTKKEMMDDQESNKVAQPKAQDFTRREFIGTMVVGAATAALSDSATGTAPQRKDKPNVICFFSDTHRWGAMSFTQTPHVKTPYMERMRDDGVCMDHCYSGLPICSPYRNILISGRWPWQHGQMANHMSLANRVDESGDMVHRGSLAWMFRNSGYNTGYFGKSHWGGNDVRPFGFDKSIVWNGTNNHITTKYRVDGGEANTWRRGSTDDSNCTPTVTQALDWIDDHYNEPDPFFIMISTNPPHGKMTDAPEGKKKLYPDLDSLPWHPHDELHQFDQHQGYHAHVSDTDDEIGRILAKLDELGIAEDTIFIYTSDHGGMSGVRGISYGQKRNPEDESSRVPFLIQWPGTIPANTRLDTLFATIDHFPTLCSLANIPRHLAQANTPEARRSLEYLNACPGVDLSRNILGLPGGPDPESVFICHPSNMSNNSPDQVIFRGVVSKTHMYSVTPEGEYCLYDCKEDYQHNNLVKDPDTYSIRLRHWEMIRDWMSMNEAPFLDNWFANMPFPKGVKAWNKEHGFGAVEDREIGKSAVFDINKSRPVE